MSKISSEFKDNKINVSADLDQDGTSSIKLSIHAAEAFAEAFKKGGEIEGAKVLFFGFVGTNLVLKLDTDKDGEQSLELSVDLPELFGELVK